MPPRKKPKPDAVAVTPAVVEGRIHVIRGLRVMLDSDLAELYGVTTFRLNEQVKRNAVRFPDDFAFQLSRQEVADLTSQNAMSSSRHGGRRTLPWVFTEQGVAMLSSVLRSPQAVAVNIEIMRAFVRLRRLVGTPGELVAQIQQLAETVRLHDEEIRWLMDVLQSMQADPPVEENRRRIGFHPPEPPPSAPAADGD